MGAIVGIDIRYGKVYCIIKDEYAAARFDDCAVNNELSRVGAAALLKRKELYAEAAALLGRVAVGGDIELKLRGL